MEYNDHPQNTDQATADGGPFDFLQSGAGKQTKKLPDILINGSPYGWQNKDRFQQTTDLERDSLRQQAQHSMGNLGGIGNIFDEQFYQDEQGEEQPRRLASYNLGHPFSSIAHRDTLPERVPAQGAEHELHSLFGGVDDVIAEYRNFQFGESQPKQIN